MKGFLGKNVCEDVFFNYLLQYSQTVSYMTESYLTINAYVAYLATWTDQLPFIIIHWHCLFYSLMLSSLTLTLGYINPMLVRYSDRSLGSPKKWRLYIVSFPE